MLVVCLALGALAAADPAGRRPLDRWLSRPSRRVRRHRQLPCGGARARAARTARTLPTPCGSSRPTSSTSPASASCRWTGATAAGPRCASAPDDPALDTHSSDGPGARHRVHPRDPPRRAALPPVLALLPGLEQRPRRVGPPLGAVLDSAAAARAGWRAHPTIPAFIETTGRGCSSASIPTAAPGCAPARTAASRAASGGSAATSGSARTGWVRVTRGSHSGHVPFRIEPRRGGPGDARRIADPALHPAARLARAPRRRVPLIPAATWTSERRAARACA